MTDRETNETTLEELRSQALKHYTEASNAIHHWSSFVEDAINNYTPPKFRGTDRERAEEILKKKYLLIEDDRTCEAHTHLVVDAMLEFRNEGLREELIKYDKWNLAGSHGAIPTESILKNIDNYFKYLKTKE